MIILLACSHLQILDRMSAPAFYALFSVVNPAVFTNQLNYKLPDTYWRDSPISACHSHKISPNVGKRKFDRAYNETWLLL